MNTLLFFICSTVQSQMPSLVATVFEEFRQFDSPVFRVLRKKVKKACKKAYKKLTSAFHKPNNRVHCENTPYFCSVAVQTTSEPLIQSLSHGGELDMSYHLNTNQSNNRGLSRPLIHGQGEQIHIIILTLQLAALIITGALCAVETIASATLLIIAVCTILTNVFCP